MEKQEIEIRRRLVDFIRDAINEDSLAYYTLYGFYVSKFNKVCDIRNLADKMADELNEADKETKQVFLDMVETMDAVMYDNIGLRVCSECGKFMIEGYYLAGEYACSDECAIKNYMHTSSRRSKNEMVDEETAKKLFEKDLEYDEEHCVGDVYYTEW